MQSNKPVRVLVVDDDETLRDLYVQALEMAKYQVEAAENGHEALAMYEKAIRDGSRYQVVVMDLNMPGLDGCQTLECLLEFDENAKVIIATGSELGIAVMESLKSKTVGLVRKPFSLTSLFAEVSRAVA